MGRDKFMTLGTVSEGTLRQRDLTLALIAALDRVKLAKADRNVVRQVASLADLRGEGDDYWADEAAGFDYEALVNIADAHTPPYTRFGAHEGDGALIGVWVDEEMLALEVDRGAQLPDSAFGINQDYFLVVTDHGKTLWRSVRAGRVYRWREVWSRV